MESLTQTFGSETLFVIGCMIPVAIFLTVIIYSKLAKKSEKSEA